VVVEHTTEPKADGRLMEQSVHWSVWLVRPNCGATNGNDLVAAYARQSKHFPRPVVEVALAMTDTGDRAQKYSQGQMSFVFGMIRNILGAVFLGGWRRK